MRHLTREEVQALLDVPDPRTTAVVRDRKAPYAEVRGFDRGKLIVGRKRHVAVDTDGRLPVVNLTPADVSDSTGAQINLDAIRSAIACWIICTSLISILATHSRSGSDGNGGRPSPARIARSAR